MYIGAFKMLRNVLIFTDNASKYEDASIGDDKVRVLPPSDLLKVDFG